MDLPARDLLVECYVYRALAEGKPAKRPPCPAGGRKTDQKL